MRSENPNLLSSYQIESLSCIENYRQQRLAKIRAEEQVLK
jgi:hypothetical protein